VARFLRPCVFVSLRSCSMSLKFWVSCCVGLCLSAPLSAHAARPAFVYVNANPNNGSNSLSAVRIAESGQSEAIPGSPFSTDGFGLSPAPGAEFAHRIEVSRSRNLLFAANDGSGTIAAFTVNPFSGGLRAVPGSPFSVPGWSSYSGISLAVSDDGRFLYASGLTLVSFFIDAAGGLTPVGSQWQFPQRVGGIDVTNDNSRLFLNTSDAVYIMDTGEAGLTTSPPVILSVGSSATDLRLDPPNTHLWVGTKNGGILAYLLSGGTQTVVPGAPFFSSVSNLSGLSADSFGRNVFAHSPVGPRLFGARSNTDGSLIAAVNSPIPLLFAPTAAALIPDGSMLMLADAQGRLDAWSTEADGSLFHVAGYPVTTGAAPGFAAAATFPEKTPTPAPASPVWWMFALATALGFVGRRRAQLARG
jgi:hypothetical protein